LHPARHQGVNQGKRVSPRQILRACNCEEHPLIQQARREPTQPTCVQALSEFLASIREGVPEAQGLKGPLTVY